MSHTHTCTHTHSHTHTHTLTHTHAHAHTHCSHCSHTHTYTVDTYRLNPHIQASELGTGDVERRIAVRLMALYTGTHTLLFTDVTGKSPSGLGDVQ